MPTTTPGGLSIPVPAAADAPNVPADFMTTMTDVETRLKQSYALPRLLGRWSLYIPQGTTYVSGGGTRWLFSPAPVAAGLKDYFRFDPANHAVPSRTTKLRFGYSIVWGVSVTAPAANFTWGFAPVTGFGASGLNPTIGSVGVAWPGSGSSSVNPAGGSSSQHGANLVAFTTTPTADNFIPFLEPSGGGGTLAAGVMGNYWLYVTNE